MSLPAIDKAIEQRVIKPLRRHKETLIERDGLVVMAILRYAGVDLPVRVKHQVRRWVSEQRPHEKSGDQVLEVSDVIALRLSSPVRDAVADAEDYVAARERFVVRDPDIFGGQPVIAGTRIPAHTVLERLERGDTIKALQGDYPHVNRRALEVAARYAKSHPRRGRPVKPWRAGSGRLTTRR